MDYNLGEIIDQLDDFASEAVDLENEIEELQGMLDDYQSGHYDDTQLDYAGQPIGNYGIQIFKISKRNKIKTLKILYYEYDEYGEYN